MAIENVCSIIIVVDVMTSQRLRCIYIRWHHGSQRQRQPSTAAAAAAKRRNNAASPVDQVHLRSKVASSLTPSTARYRRLAMLDFWDRPPRSYAFERRRPRYCRRRP